MVVQRLRSEMATLIAENAVLKSIAADLHWMARRYADGRQSYATSTFNDLTRRLLAMDVKLNATGDGTIWARDAMGRAYDHLTDEEAAMGRPIDGPLPGWRLAWTREEADAREA